MDRAQRVLVIEDEADIQEVLRYNLTKNGFDVEAASDGTSGLVLAKEMAPDLVILDLMLPGMDGLEVCRLLRKDSDVPVIMFQVFLKYKIVYLVLLHF